MRDGVSDNGKMLHVRQITGEKESFYRAPRCLAFQQEVFKKRSFFRSDCSLNPLQVSIHRAAIRPGDG